MACPFTNGSLGSCISRGTISEEEGFFDEVVKEASVFDRGRNGEDDCAGGGVAGDVGWLANAGCEGESVAEASEPVE